MAKDKQTPTAETEGKKKDKSKKKQGRIAKWFKELKLELKKVVWPSRQIVINNSIVIFAAMLGFALFTFLLDWGFLKLLELAVTTKS